LGDTPKRSGGDGRADGQTDGRERFETAPPPSASPPGEAHGFAIASDGTRLFLHSKDDGHPKDAMRVFMCDGVLCDGFIWKYLWDDLAAVAPLTHWHYRGHGRSATPADPNRIDIAAHADDLMKVRENAGNPPCVLMGHSMGCQVLLENYRAHPENVRGLVLLCGSYGKVTATFHGVPILDMILPRMLDLAEKQPELVRAVWSRIPAEMALKIALRVGELDPAKIHSEDILPYLKHMTHVDFPMFLRMVRSAGEHSAEDFLPHIAVPTLIVAGERDTFTPPFLAESMAKQIPGAELLMLKNGSHVAPLEQPEIADTRIGDFVSALVTDRVAR
jgi:pimeloyl-ACP methyl ester carboxylesterase